MYRMLIVDDERIIADALYEVFQNVMGKDMDICRAYSGNAALKWLNTTKIDIVLTDIRMPGIDGLQLLEHIHSNWPQCRVIMLTGYNEFDYVYKAIQHKGVSYLLKTEGYNKVVKTVEEAVAEIDRSLKIENLIEKANQQIALTSALLQKEYFTCLLKGELVRSDINNVQFRQLGIPLNAEQPVLLVLGRVDNFAAAIPYSEKSQSSYSIKLIAEQYFSSLTDNICIIDENSDFIWFIQPKLQDKTAIEENHEISVWERAKIFVRGMLEMIQASCNESLKLSVSFSSGNDPVGWDCAAEKKALLKQLLDYKIGAGKDMLLTDKNTESCFTNFGDTDKTHRMQTLLKKTGALETYIERGQKYEFFLLFDELTGVILEIPGMHSYMAMEIYYSISLKLLSFINRWSIAERMASRADLSQLTHLDQNSSWKDAIVYLKKMAEMIFSTQDKEQEKRATDAIAKVQKYIDEHVTEELSLVRLADLVYFNPSYLSRLFKQVTGENLSDYIVDSKIKRAKQLLEMPEVKIHEISQAFGYGSAQNFSRFFKKITNITPQEYREAYLKRI